jgi:hypothetical protein
VLGASQGRKLSPLVLKIKHTNLGSRHQNGEIVDVSC